MKDCFMYLLVFFIFFSCKRKEITNEYVYFESRDLKIDTLHNKVIKYKVLMSTDSIKLFDNQNLITKFQFSIKENGISVVKENVSTLLYSFIDTTTIERSEDLVPPFYKSVQLVNKKDYQLKGKKRTIYHFIENGYDETLDSYYMDDVGFICFYRYADDNFIYLDSPEAIEVGSQFLVDSAFFSMLKLREIDKKMGRKFNKCGN